MIGFEFLKVSTMCGNGDVINDSYRIVPSEELEMEDMTLDDLLQLHVYLGKFIQRELELEKKERKADGHGQHA